MPVRSSVLCIALFIIGRTAVPVSLAAGEPDAAPADAAALPVDCSWLPDTIFPGWAEREALREDRIDYRAELDAAGNGAALAERIRALRPGDRLAIGPGTWSTESWSGIAPRGSAEHPIWIVGADPDRRPVLTRPDAEGNVLDIAPGEDERSAYLCLRDLELTGGDWGLRLHRCAQLWVDRCHIHHTGNTALTANTQNTHHLFITRNEIHHTDGYGEGMYLGGNHGAVVMRHSVIARNHVHHCAGTQGDGIELKQGSHHNWIVENHVHDTNYPCIIVYGTGGEGINVVERNVCYRSRRQVLQAQGEALLRNNLAINGQFAVLDSHDHQAESRDLIVVHNTFVGRHAGWVVNLKHWAGRPGMVFANNAVYGLGGRGLRIRGGPATVQVAGNVVLGEVQGVTDGFVRGRGLADFLDLTADGSRRDATPVVGAPLVDAADARYRAALDRSGRPRDEAPDVGAVERR